MKASSVETKPRLSHQYVALPIARMITTTTTIGRRARLIQPLGPPPRSGAGPRGLRGGSFRAIPPRAVGPEPGEGGGVPVAGALGVESLGIWAVRALSAGRSLVLVASELNRSVCV